LDKNLVLIPISAIIVTADRSAVFRRTIMSLLNQSVVPIQIIVIDASNDQETALVCDEISCQIHWVKANKKGAATQRNEGISFVSTDFVFFMDDDIILEENCVLNLWNSIKDLDNVGGVNAMITNQKYKSPGIFTKLMYQFMHGRKMNTYSGMCIGPAWNLLPEDNDNLPNKQSVEWLNTTCTIYRKEALPMPAFPERFTGYSLLEDVCLSLQVAKKWKLLNIRSAKIFHDSQPGVHKKNDFELAKMELINRYFIMNKILDRKGFKYNLKLFLFQIFGIVTSSSKFKIKVWLGKLSAIYLIAKEIHEE
jgi:glycosyltransferase involved in cell wall biosynthesis